MWRKETIDDDDEEWKHNTSSLEVCKGVGFLFVHSDKEINACFT